MIENIAQSDGPASVETVLRDELAHGDAMIGTIAPILRHLLANDEHSVFGDEIIAAMRGMMADVARQLLDARTEAAGDTGDREHDPAQIAAMVEHFSTQPGFLAHVHALALEWQLTNRLQARLALDPVLSPLLQALIASNDASVAASSMALLAAQARFVQNQRRMQLPLSELPGDLLHAGLLALRGVAADDAESQNQAVVAEQKLRASFDESRSRLGLISRLVTGMGGGATVALSVTHAGLAIFLSALAIASGQDRDMATLATNESQVARLALALRACGLRPEVIEEQFGSLHPEVTLPPNFEQLGADHAAALLARSAAYPGG
jgi:hypothetical protein